MAPSGRRAAALIQVGRNTRAERELRFMANAADRDLTEALIAVAENKSLPMISYRAGAALIGAAGPIPPVPCTRCPNGSHAKVFASTARWSSRSCARNRHSTCARSSAGARTDAVDARNRRIYRPEKVPGKRRNQLYEPALNIPLARDIRHLLESDTSTGTSRSLRQHITAVRATSANGNGGRSAPIPMR